MKLSTADKAKQAAIHLKMVGSPIEEAEEPKARLDLSEKDLPAIKDWKVGETYNIEAEAKMISMSKGGYDGTQPMRATFELSDIEEEPQDDETNEKD